ncbi:MAG: diguanylate cyclase [Sedimentibacter sp.]|uniref:diguanylate cyclase n=1 Tax=Sedimentibacter sp. TaxID=1960295 RepID=UPI003158A493
MMEAYDKKTKKRFSRDSIIGLGEDSFRKNYYPELQDKIHDLEKTNARNRAIISTIPDILLVSDSEGNITPFTIAAKAEDDMLSRFLNNQEIMETLSRAARQVQQVGSFYIEELKIKISDQSYYFEARFHQTESNEVLIMLRNMTERILMEHRLRDMVERDNLTNLYNRRSFEETMRRFSGKDAEKIAVISIDLNGLKFINDTLGHLAGDRIIVDVAMLINEVFGQHGHLSRIGGDEFGVILEKTEESQIERMLNNLTQRVERYNLSAPNGSMSVAYGYAYHRSGLVNMEYLFQVADNNMYQNKLLKKESTRGTFVKTLMKALEAKDYVSEGHVIRMEQLAVHIGEALSLHQDQMDRLVLLTKFHDIGKIGIPDSILKKPAKLMDDEWNVMKTHTSIGERIALESMEIKDIAPLILHHHERWNGTGYPSGLAYEDIPIECRILAIVDSFDAMTNDRPYHKAMSASEATREIVSCSGTFYDPNLVDIFYRIQSELQLI